MQERIQPDNQIEIDGLFRQAVIAHQRHELHEAIAGYRAVLTKVPNHVSSLVNLSVALQAKGEIATALEYLKNACNIAPDDANALSNLGALYQKLGQLTKAIPCFEHCIKHHPDYAMAYANLGFAKFQYGLLGEALSCTQRALRLEPYNTVAQLNLGLIEVNRGNIDQGLKAFEQVLMLEPSNKSAASNKVYASTYSDELSDKAVFELHQQWGDKLSSRIKPYTTWKRTPSSHQRKLRIAYLSADFHAHPVSYVFTSFFPYHNRDKFEVISYVSNTKQDETTRLIESHSDESYQIMGLSDEALARHIRDNRIDILIELGGHTAKSRLPVLAYKPAPIQASYLGYPMTTGLSTVDYLIGDNQVCPKEHRHLYTEKLACLPSVFCFKPHSFAPKITKLPALQNGYITFGCYNNLPKLTPKVIGLWARVLKAVPTSRLILKSRPFADESTKRRYQRLFKDNGIEPARVEYRGPSPHPQMLNELNEIDIALDPFPFGGGITTCETLWQGVPLITLRGTRFSQNMGTSFLTNLGLTDWIATSHEQYIEIAKTMSQDMEKLSMLREELRDKMARSVICDGRRIAMALERQYQGWQERRDSETNGSCL